MKTFENGVMSESDGPPLDHDEWVENQAKLQQEAQRAQANASAGRRRGGAPDASPDTYGTGKHPLSYFDNKSDEEILRLSGIGQGTLEQIREAQGKPAAK